MLVVEVREKGPAGHHLVIPVPLLPLRTAAAFVPPATVDLADHGRALDPDAREALKSAGKVLDALEAAPDGELVRVEEPQESVLISKEDGRLRVSAHSTRGEQVEVEVPLSLAREVVADAQDGTVDPGAVLRAVGACPRGRLVEVRDRDADVRIRIL